MRKTSLILIRTDKKEVYINRYNVRKTNGGQLVLELKERKGSIYRLLPINPKSFVAIMTENYQNHSRKIKTQIGEAIREIAQTEKVVATLNDNEIEKFTTYEIIIFYNNMILERINSKKSVVVLENEILIEIDEGKKIIFSLRKTNDSLFINLEKIQLEENLLYANIQNVELIDKNTSCNKSVCIFDREWANKMLRALLNIKNDSIIYPTLKGKWIKDKDSKLKVLPKNVYSKKLNGREPTKEFWREYLQNVIEIEVEYPEEKVIRQKYKK